MAIPWSNAGNNKGVKLGGALSGIVKESRISKNDLLDVFHEADVVPPEDYSRQQVVRTGLTAATDHQAVEIATTLIAMLRKEGLFTSTQADEVARVEKLKATFASLGASLSDAGDVTWGANAAKGSTTTSTGHQMASPLSGSLPVTSPQNPYPGEDSAPEPMLTRDRSLPNTVTDIGNLLERLPFASHSLTVKRRKDRTVVHISDEYDVQDFVFMALRLLYQPVVDEQPSGKKGGDGFNKGDFYLEDHKIMVEAKVAKKGHGAKEIKKEIAVDQAAYRTDTTISALIVVIYDLDYTIPDKEALKKHLEEDPKTSVVLMDWFRSEPNPPESPSYELDE